MLIILLGPLAATAGGAPPRTVTITILDQPPTVVQSRAGLLLGYFPEGKPNSSLLLPLRPGLIRAADWRLYDRAQAAGASFEFVLSELWGYPPNHYNGTHVPPYADLDRWDNLVRSAARQAAGRANVRWDVWNEPNWAPFFDGSEQQYFDVYLHAYRVLRSELGPGAVIGGPSIWHFDLAFVQRFLEFCRQHNCQINFISWHDNTAPPDDPAVIAAHARAVRALAAEPQYRAVGVRQIEINETVGPHDQYFPASALRDLSELEAGDVAFSARSCWPNRTGVGNCFNNSLDGLVVPNSNQPTASWWLYQSYAASLGRRLASRTNRPDVVALASVADARTTELLIGYDRSAEDTPITPVLALPHPASGRRDVVVDAKIIPVDDGRPLSRLQSIARFSADAAHPITLPVLHCNEVLTITIRRQ